MAKTKKTKPQKQAAFSPEKYLRDKARQLPIEKCYINTGWKASGVAYVCVVRRHPQGTCSYAMFLVDIWCRGVYDCFYSVNVDDQSLESILSTFGNIDIEEVDYSLVHNIIYGAVEFAGEAGIGPHPSFNVARYILEEDTDDVPYIDIEFGKDGKYCLVMFDQKESQRYVKLLDKNVGPDNYHYIHGIDTTHDKFNPGVEGVYGYLSPERPDADISNLHNRNLVEVLSSDILSVPEDSIRQLLAGDCDALRSDLHAVIISTIHDTWQGIEADDDSIDNLNYEVLPNALLLLAQVADESSAEIVYEVLRQSERFLDFYFADVMPEFIFPVVCNLFVDNPGKVLEFMHERGLSSIARQTFMEELTQAVMVLHPEHSGELEQLYASLFDYYLEHKDDAYVWDGMHVAFMISHAMDCGFADLMPRIKRLYDTGLVDESIAGDASMLEEAFSLASPDNFSVFPTDIFEWIDDRKERNGITRG